MSLLGPLHQSPTIELAAVQCNTGLVKKMARSKADGDEMFVMFACLLSAVVAKRRAYFNDRSATAFTDRLLA